MAVKKRYSIINILLIAFVFIVFAIPSAGAAFAADPINARIERVSANMPEVKAYLYAENAGALSTQDIKATLDGKALTIDDAKSFAASGEGVAYIFLIDVSTSITNTQMKATIDALSAFSDDLQAKDRMVLLTFGKRVETLLAGGEDMAARQKAIGLLANNQDGTAFYDAIKQAVLIASNVTDALPERTVALAISDGEDYNDGGVTKQEVDKALADSSLPLFALGLSEVNTGSNTALDNFGETARTSGGAMTVTNAAELGDNFTNTISAINDCFVVNMKSDSNVISAERQALSITVSSGGASATAEKEVQIKDWIPDTTPPEATSPVQLPDQNGIHIEFSKPLLGADNPAAYTVTDGSDAPVAIQSVVYMAKDGTVSVDILFAEQLYSGEYTVSFNGITDNTMEKNPLTGHTAFQLKGKSIFLKYIHTIFVDYWWAVFIVVFVIVILIVFRTIRKRKGLIRVDGKLSFGAATEFKHHFETPETAHASLILTDMKGEAHRIELDINKSLFVGRAKSNNLSFDDAKMSRQHFVIEVENGEYFISDLNTTNGTLLNGVRVSGKRKLNINDVITAGNEKFVFKAGEGA